MNCLAMSKAKTKKQPKANIKPVVAIVGIRAIPKAEQIANKTHLITYNIIIPSFSCFNIHRHYGYNIPWSIMSQVSYI